MREFLVAFLNERETFEKYITPLLLLAFFMVFCTTCLIILAVFE